MKKNSLKTHVTFIFGGFVYDKTKGRIAYVQNFKEIDQNFGWGKRHLLFYLRIEV